MTALAALPERRVTPRRVVANKNISINRSPPSEHHIMRTPMLNTDSVVLGRRAFLKGGSLVLASAGLELAGALNILADEKSASGGVRFGLITDLHYADKPPAGT